MQECSPDAVYKLSVSREPVPDGLVRGWMRCDDIQVMGVLWHHVLFFRPERFAPELSREEIQEFQFTYYARCLADDPQGRWADDRIKAAKDVVRWFWEIEEFGPDDLDPEDVKVWVADTYLHGDEETRTAIVQRILARVCEYDMWREFFADWGSDAGLREAYSTATALGTRNSVEDVVNDLVAAVYSDREIPLTVVQCWMDSDHADLLGAVWEYIVDCEAALTWVKPTMSHDIGEAFALRYYAMCINEDPDSKFGLTRYEATWDVLRWVHSLDCKHDREQIERIVAWLTDLAVEGDDAIRDAITCGALEHILEKPCYRPFFTHWARHPLLQSSHTAAMHWALAHETE